MIEIVVVPASGALQIAFSETNACWPPDAGYIIVNDGVLPMLGNGATSPNAPPSKPCLVLHMEQGSMVNGVVTPMLGGALTTPGTTPPNPR